MVLGISDRMLFVSFFSFVNGNFLSAFELQRFWDFDWISTFFHIQQWWGTRIQIKIIFYLLTVDARRKNYCRKYFFMLFVTLLLLVVHSTVLIVW